MKRIYHLGTCTTCQRIMKELGVDGDWEIREIKSKGITEEEIEHMHQLAGSYEALFSRRAMKYKSLGLKDKNLTELDYKSYIMEEYTFLKRPVVIIDDKIFIGNSAKTVADIKAHI